MNRLQNRLQTAAAALGLALLCTAAQADGEGRAAVPLLPKFQQECGACHVAFAPRLLPAAGWQALMANLPRHFGSDASLDAAATREITTWLVAHAGSGRRAENPPEQRITRSAWFQREHREVGAATWQRPFIQKPSNCAACHRGAAQGQFDEHDLRIPR